MNAGIGARSTREDHRGVADQISAFLGRGRELRRLTSIVGEQALSDDDRSTLGFVDDFERRFVGQGGGAALARAAARPRLGSARALPGSELKWIGPQLVARYDHTRRRSRDGGGNARHPRARSGVPVQDADRRLRWVSGGGRMQLRADVTGRPPRRA